MDDNALHGRLLLTHLLHLWQVLLLLGEWRMFVIGKWGKGNNRLWNPSFAFIAVMAVTGRVEEICE